MSRRTRGPRYAYTATLTGPLGPQRTSGETETVDDAFKKRLVANSARMVGLKPNNLTLTGFTATRIGGD